MAEIDDLIAQVSKETTVDQSSLTLLDGFDARLAAAGDDSMKLARLRLDLKTRREDLAAALKANTHTTSTGRSTSSSSST